MEYKTILVHLDRGARSRARLDLGFALADACGAHLVGLYALSAAQMPSYVRAEASRIIIEAEEKNRGEAQAAAEAMFRAAAQRNGGVKSEWRASKRDALAAVRLSARYADLVVAGQREPEDDSGLAPDFTEELVLSTGRPVLFMPYAGKFERLCRRVLVAWNAGREAARAVTDALPLLARAEKVEVVAFSPEKGGADHGDVPGADIGLFLARHGVKVTVAAQYGEDLHIGEQILSRAADFGADLIVMGAYGHSRMRQIVLGGATRTLLEAMTAPVLMSH